MAVTLMLTAIVATILFALVYGLSWHNQPANEHDRAWDDHNHKEEINPDKIRVELSHQRRPDEVTYEELTEGHEHSRQWVPSKAGNLKREQAALWLFIVAVIIISFLVGYLFWLKLFSHSPS